MDCSLLYINVPIIIYILYSQLFDTIFETTSQIKTEIKIAVKSKNNDSPQNDIFL